MEFVEISAEYTENPSSFWWCKSYYVIWSNSREQSKNVFAVNLGHRDNVYEFWLKHSLNVLQKQTRLQNSTDTTRKRLIFHIFCALFEKIPLGINRDILKNPTWSGAKNSNNLCAPSHLVTWIPHCVNIHLWTQSLQTLTKSLSSNIFTCLHMTGLRSFIN